MCPSGMDPEGYSVDDLESGLNSLLPLLSAILALALCACAPSKYKFGTLESRYESPSLAVHFATGRDRISLSVYAVANDQGRTGYRREFTARADRGGGHLYADADTVSGILMTFED